MVSWATSDGREHEGERVVAAASTIKIFIASAFWRSELDPAEPAPVETTPFSVSDQLRATLTLGDLAVLMLAVSDNAATNAIVDRLGLEAVNAEIRRLGLARTVVRRQMVSEGPENLTTARDLAQGLARVAEEEPRIVHALMLARDSLVPRLIAPGVAVAVKTGELDSVYHEAALLDDGRRRLAIAVCTSPADRPDRVAKRIAALAVPEKGDRPS